MTFFEEELKKIVAEFAIWHLSALTSPLTQLYASP